MLSIMGGIFFFCLFLCSFLLFLLLSLVPSPSFFGCETGDLDFFFYEKQSVSRLKLSSKLEKPIYPTFFGMFDLAPSTQPGIIRFARKECGDFFECFFQKNTTSLAKLIKRKVNRSFQSSCLFIFISV